MAYAKRWLFLIHRWLGIFACIFFVMWFISGIVMMYVGYPKLTAAERIQHLPPLNAAAITLTPRQALDAAGIKGPLQDLRLAVASGGRAVYLAVPARDLNVGLASGRRRVAPGSGTVVIDASTGIVLRQVDRAHVLASAAVFGGLAVAADYGGIIDEDAFTHSRALDAHHPLHRVRLADADATLLYVSSTTGEVVRDVPRIERLWNYVGAWIHWLYPFRGNMFNAYWTDIVIWLSILGIGLALTGATVGIMRWRFTRVYKRGSHSPYHGFVMRWHHILGLLFALVTLTWIFSGLMSMNPWKIFDSGAKALNTVAMNGGPLNISSKQASPQQLLAAAPNGVRELHWIRASGQTLVLANISGSARPTVFNAESANVYVPDFEALKTNVARLLPDPIARIEVLTDYDLYYYSREPHTMTGGSEKFLPVRRVVFDNAHATWVHIDPATGTVLGHTDSTKRLSRWLFAMLHSWDWLPLLERRPLWDIVLISLSLCGTALSLSGVVIGWRRLGRKLRSVRVRRFARL